MKRIEFFILMAISICVGISCFPLCSPAQSDYCLEGQYKLKLYKHAKTKLFDNADLTIHQVNCGIGLIAESKGDSGITINWKGSITDRRKQDCCDISIGYVHGEDVDKLVGNFCRRGNRWYGSGDWFRIIAGKIQPPGKWSAQSTQVLQKQLQQRKVKDQKKMDTRFVANIDGTIVDMKTNLMWATKDNGRNIDWQNAKRYCENYRGGGYTDWRMPNQDELASLYDDSLPGYESEACSSGRCGGNIKVTNQLHLSSHLIWGLDTLGLEAFLFIFTNGTCGWVFQNGANGIRALPVRNAK